jgi:ABC-type Na+ efflux pump permease subunit
VDLQRVGLSWDVLLIAAGCGVGAVAVLLLVRRLIALLLGPIFAYETLRLARKGHTFWLRTAFALLTLALLYMAKPSEVRMPTTGGVVISVNKIVHLEPDLDYAAQRRQAERVRMERFAAEFTQSFMLALAVAVMLVTPLYTATAISEEKEKRTLDFLLATRLTSNDIVLGKLAARLLNLFGITLAALPILALTQLWGGVDWRLIAYGFAVVLAMLVSYACVGLMCSVVFARTRNAVIAAYAIVLGLNLIGFAVETPPHLCMSPVALLRNIAGLIASLDYPSMTSRAELIIGRHVPFALFHFGLLVMGLAIATTRLRSFAALHAGRTRRVMAPLDPENEGRLIVPHPLTIAPNPPLAGDPFIWKEQYLGRTIGAWFLGRTLWVYSYLILGLLLVCAVMIALEGLGGWLSPFNLVMRVVCVLLQLLVLLSIALRMAACVSREREQQTLVSLLTLPVNRGRILRAKWLGTWRRARWAVGGLAMAFVTTGLAAGIQGAGWFLLPVVFAAHVWFFGNLGLLLSITCRSTNRAYSLLLASLLVIVVGSWVISYFAARQVEPTWGRGGYEVDEDLTWLDNHWQTYFAELVSPPQTWWYLTTPAPRAFRVTGYAMHVGVVVVAAMGYFAAGSYCWFCSFALFRRKGAPA